MGIIRRFIDRRGEALRNRFSLTVGGGQGHHADTRDPMRPPAVEVTPTALSVRSTLAPLSLGQQKQITVAEPVERLGAPLSYLRPDTIELDYRHRINRGMVTVPCWALNQALTITPMLADKVRFWTNSIKQMQWKIEPVTGADAAKVTAQTEALKAAYAAQDLPATLEHLAKAPFYGFAHIAKTAPRWSLLDPWNFVRDGLYGDWFWNGDLRITNSVGLPDDARLDVSRYIIREYTDPLLLQMLGQFVDVKNIRRWWNVNMEQESKRQVVVIAGAGIANPDEFQRSATEISGGRSGVLEGGEGDTKTQVLFPPASRGLPYYENALKFADGEITKALTGGTLTMLSSSGSGSFAGQAHSETLDRLMEAEAMAIAQVLRDQVDVPALKDAGLLKDGESPAAQFSLSAVKQADPAAEADIVAKLWTAGLEVDVEEESARLGRKLKRVAQPVAGAGGPGGGPDGGNANNLAKARKPSPTGGRQAVGGNEPVKNRAASDDPRAGKLLAKARAELPLAVQKDLFHVAQSLNELYNAAGAVTGDDIKAFIAKLPDALTAHGATAESAAAWQGFISSALIDGATTDKPDALTMANRDDDGTQSRDDHGRWAAMSDAELDAESKNIRAQFDAVQKQHRAYNMGQNEGARDGYNQHESKLQEHADRFTAIEKEKEKRDWTLEKTEQRRTAWNAEILRRKNAGEPMNLHDIQQKMGFRFDQMKEHVARHSFVSKPGA